MWCKKGIHFGLLRIMQPSIRACHIYVYHQQELLSSHQASPRQRRWDFHSVVSKHQSSLEFCSWKFANGYLCFESGHWHGTWLGSQISGFFAWWGLKGFTDLRNHRKLRDLEWLGWGKQQRHRGMSMNKLHLGWFQFRQPWCLSLLR